MSEIELLQGDCLKLMKDINDKSVDMILCDLPYGTTACKWDVVIPFEPLWEQYNRVIKNDGVIVLFGSEPFSSYLRMSNIKSYKYDWIWHKSKESNFMLLKKQPRKDFELIHVFYKKQPTYNPQMEKAKRINGKNKGKWVDTNIQDVHFERKEYEDTGLRHPSSVQFFSNQSKEVNNVNRLHPTQKPVALLEYLINTYTNQGDVVLDNCMGSGSTGVACVNIGRKFIGMELDENYFNIAKERIERSKVY